MKATEGRKTGTAARRKRRSVRPRSGLDLLEIERRLTDERRAVLLELSSDSFAHEDLGQWQERDSASEDEIREVMYTRREAQRRRLNQLDEALERLRAGSFAICVNCGKKIISRRLESDPAVALCIECAKLIDVTPQATASEL